VENKRVWVDFWGLQLARSSCLFDAVGRSLSILICS